MASAMVGRAPCPECGFAAAHVKRSEKTLYRHCPECGSQYIAKRPELERLLLEKTRLLDAGAKGSGGATATPTEAAPVAVVVAAAPATVAPAVRAPAKAPAVRPAKAAPVKAPAVKAPATVADASGAPEGRSRLFNW